MNNTKNRLLALVAVLLACPTLALAQDPLLDTGGGPSRTFGKARQLAIMGESSFEISRATESDTTTISLAPAADFFVIDNLSVGAFLGFQYLNVGDSNTTIFSIGPRVGYNFPFTDSISLWPKVGFSFVAYNADDNDNTGLALNLFAPFMFHPVTHFFVGVGPFLDVGLSGEDKDTKFGIKLTIGGWLEL